MPWSLQRPNPRLPEGPPVPVVGPLLADLEAGIDTRRDRGGVVAGEPGRAAQVVLRDLPEEHPWR